MGFPNVYPAPGSALARRRRRCDRPAQVNERSMLIMQEPQAQQKLKTIGFDVTIQDGGEASDLIQGEVASMGQDDPRDRLSSKRIIRLMRRRYAAESVGCCGLVMPGPGLPSTSFHSTIRGLPVEPGTDSTRAYGGHHPREEAPSVPRAVAREHSCQRGSPITARFSTRWPWKPKWLPGSMSGRRGHAKRKLFAPRPIGIVMSGPLRRASYFLL